MYYVEFGENLKKLRTARGLTQKEFGERVGLSKAVVSKYENAMGYPSLDTLIKIAAYFGVSTDYILGAASKKTLDVSTLTDEQVEAINGVIAQFKNANKK